jgi:CRP/FNR family transcriptional regulator, dissimilatory nitrate respiration regulator
MTRIDHIKTIPLFEGMSENHQQDLASIVMDQTLKKGKIIFSEGDEGIGFYVIIAGQVKIFKLSVEGKEQILHILGPGEPFGEVPVFTGARFPAHAEALEDTRLFFFPRVAFVNLIRENPSLALNMLAVLSRRLRLFARMIEDLSLKEVPGRLAVYLLYLRDRNKGADEVKLDITKVQLANLLGTSPETLSRIFSKMTKQGYIELDGPRITIMDHPALENLASEGKLL